MREAKSDRHAKGNRQIHNYNHIFLYPSLLIDLVGMKISKAIDLNSTINQFELTVIYSSNNRIQVIFNCLWNIYQDMLYSEPQNKYQ